MTQRRSFDKDFLQQEFEKLSSRIDKPVTLFLIGGGGLAFYGLKVATKDMDIAQAHLSLSFRTVPLAHPDLYARNVIQGWVDFWKAPVYWEPGHVSSDGMRTFLATWACTCRIVTSSAAIECAMWATRWRLSPPSR